MRRRRRRLPSGGHPHHPVRRGAAAGARRAGRRHVQRPRSGRAAPACRRSWPPRPPRCSAWPRRFPTTEQHHPYNNRTIYGAAKAFNEGLLRSFDEMYGLDYVALRYFNVYGPRMDVYGAYTEVLIRWMERIAAGQPPLIFGDGSQTMDFVHVHDIARANMLAAKSDVTDEVFNVASGTETSLNELAHDAARRSWARTLQPEHAAAAQGQPGAAPPGRHEQGEAAARLRAEGRTRGRAAGPGRLVAAANAVAGRVRADEQHDRVRFRSPSRCSAKREVEAVRRVDPVGLGDAGAGSRRLRAGVRRACRRAASPARSRTAPPRCTWRCSPSASAPATR